MTGLEALRDTLGRLDRHLRAIVQDEEWRAPLLSDLRPVVAEPALRPLADALEDALERFARVVEP